MKLDAAVDDALVDALLIRTEGVPAAGGHACWPGGRRPARSTAAASATARRRSSPPAVVELVRARVDQLPDPERRLLVVLSLGSALDDDLVAGLAELAPDELGATTEGLHAAGLLVPGHDEALPLVAEAVLAITPEADRRRLHGRCADALTTRGDPPARAAEHLLASGASGPDAAATLVAAADAALGEGLAGTAGELLDRAAEMGGVEVAGRRAEAAALTGDLDAAVELADTALAESDPVDRARATAVLAGVLGGRGPVGPLGSAVRVGTRPPGDARRRVPAAGRARPGRAGATRRCPRRARTGGRRARPPGAPGGRSRRSCWPAARPMPAPVTCGPPSTRSSSRPSSSSRVRRALVLPETPHGLGALTAVAACDFTLAEHLLRRALEHEAGGPGLVARHRLLLGWVSLRAGRWAQSEAALDETKPEGLAVREQILRAALDSGLARRQGDIARLTDGVGTSRAGPAPLPRPTCSRSSRWASSPSPRPGCGSAGTAVDKLAEAGAIVAALGHPPLWELPLRWASLETAVAAEDTDVAAQCATALASVAPVHDRLAGLAAAARAWVELLDGTIERDRGGGRRVRAHRCRAALGGVSPHRPGGHPHHRPLRRPRAARAGPRPEGRAARRRSRRRRCPGPSALSEREQEVADFVLDGLTHKEIGAQLFISPKTVEHHVAKIRQKLGASTRAEMLAALRAQAG